ncbi:MAG: peptidoglycan-associated lipoprotein Pal [Methylococcaceae bacterium]|nr:peptidoglycan-associated lipoprotein Pal [Methylococcaceae bacterium]
MNLSFNKLALALALTTLLMSGCSSTDDKDAGFTDENTAGSGVQTSGTGDNALSGSELGGSNGGGANGYGSDGMGGAGGGPDGTKTIYFMYDSSQVMEEFVPVIAAHARSLKSNSGQHVIVEGHADERGSREYNIALSEQRAKAVKRMLTMQGAQDSQIEVVSYGEEKPASDGHDESAWQLNRRAVLDYQNR